MQEAVQAQSLPIALIRVASPQTALDILDALISETVLFFNLGNNMSDIQIRLTSELILADEMAKNLKPEDFRVLFNNAKKGHYGKAYNRMDGQVVFEWINAYVAERMSFIEENCLQEHEQFKKEPVEVNPEGQKKVLEILKSVIEKEKKSYSIRMREKSPRDQYIQKCFIDFDTLHDRDPIPSKSGRYIMWEVTRMIKDKPETFETQVDATEYVAEMLRRYDLENKL